MSTQHTRSLNLRFAVVDLLDETLSLFDTVTKSQNAQNDIRRIGLTLTKQTEAHVLITHTQNLFHIKSVNFPLTANTSRSPWSVNQTRAELDFSFAHLHTIKQGSE